VSVDLEQPASARGARRLLLVRGPLGSVEKKLKTSTGRARIRIEVDAGRGTETLNETPGSATHTNDVDATQIHVFVPGVVCDRRTRGLAGTCSSIVENMILGVTQGHTYTMRIVSTHFPINLRFNQDEGVLEIRNLLGGRQVRKARIEGNTTLEINPEGQEILIRSPDKEAAGQTAANIEAACLRQRLRGKHGKGHPLVFLDGIYIKNKPRGGARLYNV
jgi:large subunit ribosomal protein L6